MNREEQNLEAVLDQAIAAVRENDPNPADLEGARSRTWERIAQAARAEAPARVAPLGSCEDFQALFPEYRAGTLPSPRRMLVEDHTHECVSCRKVLHAGDPKDTKVVSMTPRKPVPVWRRYAIAAGLLITAGLAGWTAYDNFGPGPSGSRATVQTARGGVYRIANGALVPLSDGAEIGEGELIRTGPASHAMLRLQDGSMLEVSERAEFRVSTGRKDTTVKLDRGTVIVQAAKRSSGHLFVSSVDCLVAVTGTVFSVNRGIKGSRVSVVEGEVHVQSSGKQNVLHAGDQVATHASMGSVPIEQEISWSSNLSDHLALLGELSALRSKLEAVRLPGLRYGSRLLDLIPADSVVVISAPNLGTAVADATRLFQEQLQQSPVLSRWWGASNSETVKHLQQMAEMVKRVSEYLGDEIVVAMSAEGTRGDKNPLILADVNRPGLVAVLTAEAAKIGVAAPVVIVPESGPIPAGGEGKLLIAVRNGKLVIAEDGRAIEDVLARAASGGGSRFTATEFGRSIQKSFSQGTGILVGADLPSLIGLNSANERERETYSRMGVEQTRYLIFEQKQISEVTQHSAEVTFAGARTGFASWLGSPAPVGGLSFVSPDAQLAASAVFKKPELMMDEFIGIDTAVRHHLDEVNRTLGLNVKQDIAAALGGELTFAIDGPMLPLSWKVIAETSNPAQLQRSLQKAVDAFATMPNGAIKCKLDTEARSDAPGGAFYNLRCEGASGIPEVHYAFADGYIVLASSRQVLTQAVQNRRSGVTLARSDRFTSLLPRDQHAHFSAMVYQNAGEFLNRLSGVMSKDQRQMAGDITSQLKPMLVCAYGEQDRIQVVSKS
ncbi:MAG TPA: FecR domain-containing protein, partial [Bryobacteraceae bacterium]|nr:FecR domain-containing protein [Bryobacteraceae bacterium]